MDLHLIKMAHACLIGAYAAQEISCYNKTNNWVDHLFTLEDLVKVAPLSEMSGDKRTALMCACADLRGSYLAFEKHDYTLCCWPALETTIEDLEREYSDVIMDGNY